MRHRLADLDLPSTFGANDDSALTTQHGQIFFNLISQPRDVTLYVDYDLSPLSDLDDPFERARLYPKLYKLLNC